MSVASPSSVSPPASGAARRAWMAVFARTPRAALEAAFERALEGTAAPAFDWLRPPEIGLAMVRGRIGGSGQQFNLGEVTVTRCSVQAGGHIGHAWVRGSNPQHAELAALADAMLQDTQRHEQLQAQLLEPLARALEARREASSRKAAASKVEFFTVVRGE